jgi:hypothetical protein
MLSSPVRSVLYVVVVAVRSRLHLSLTCLNRARALHQDKIRGASLGCRERGSMGERESPVVGVLFTYHVRCGGRTSLRARRRLRWTRRRTVLHGGPSWM